MSTLGHQLDSQPHNIQQQPQEDSFLLTYHLKMRSIYFNPLTSLVHSPLTREELEPFLATAVPLTPSFLWAGSIPKIILVFA